MEWLGTFGREIKRLQIAKLSLFNASIVHFQEFVTKNQKPKIGFSI